MSKLLTKATRYTKATKKTVLLKTENALMTALTVIKTHEQTLNRLVVSAVIVTSAFGAFANAASAPGVTIGGPEIMTNPGEETMSKSVPAQKTGETIDSFYAKVTQYSYADSCHNIKQGKCLMASGKPVYVGAVACPRFLPLGTKIEVDGSTYRCEDRYATWLDAKRGVPTIDIFVDGKPVGNSIKVVNVIE